MTCHPHVQHEHDLGTPTVAGPSSPLTLVTYGSRVGRPSAQFPWEIRVQQAAIMEV
jgi:hypothetical protein